MKQSHLLDIPERSELIRLFRNKALDYNTMVVLVRRIINKAYNAGYDKGMLDDNQDYIKELRRKLIESIGEVLKEYK